VWLEREYCLFLVVPEGTSQGLKQLEVGNTKRCTLNISAIALNLSYHPQYLSYRLAVLRELWHVRWDFTEIVVKKQVQKRTEKIFCGISKNGS